MQHHVRDAAHEVLAEADLRVHRTGRGEHLAGREVAEVAGDGGRADVEGDAVGAVVEAGPDGRDRRAVVDGDRDRAGASVESARCRSREDGRVGVEPVELPLARERLPQPPEVARRRRRARRSATST